MAQPEKIPFTLSSDAIVAVVNNGMQAQGGNAILNEFHQRVAALSRTDTPSEIAAIMEGADKKGHELAKFYTDLARRVETESNQIIALKEKEHAPTLAALTSRKSALDSESSGKAGQLAAGYGVATVGAIAVDVLTTGGIVTLLTWLGGIGMGAEAISSANTLDGKVKEIEGDIARINTLLEGIRQNKTNDLKVLGNKADVLTLTPKIIAYKASHARMISNEITKYATNHGTTPDAIAEFLDTQPVDGANRSLRSSLAAMLRADYDMIDLEQLAHYAQNAKITSSPEQRALLQFINHALIPHQDYFEVWASKCHDLRSVAEDIQQAYEANNAAARPALELFKETPITLSGKMQKPRGKELLLDGIKTNAEGQAVINTALESASTLYTVRTALTDQTKSLKERHETVKAEAVKCLKQYNQFFVGIDAKLAEIDNQLNRIMPKRDRTEIRWDRAESNATQVELLKIREPGARHKHNTVVDVASVGGGLLLDAALAPFGAPPVATAAALSKLGANEIRVLGTRVREDLEHAVLKRSMEERNRLDPAELSTLKRELHELDTQIKALSDNKEFLEFVANNPALENIRSMYMLLPRLIAGESNMDAIEFRSQKAGYAQVDDFIADLRKDNPRLADAMENFLLGFANSNDLKVVLAEANAIDDPQTPKEKVLVGFVEKAIKEHYSDQARQASIVDYLEMRNVIVTSRPFYSFGEIVKKETDLALQALLTGKGDFSLVGSNDVHQIFGYYQSRHGERYFVDPHSPHDSGKMTHKRVHVADPDEIRAKREEVSFSRRADTKIPRISSVFTEICAYEYMLTQGMNVVKDKTLASSPNALGALDMVNNITQEFIQKLALESARKRKQGGDPKKPAELGHQIESLIALSFVDFFSELGARHSADPLVKDRLQKVRNAYSGENYSLANASYTDVITDSAQESFGLFLEVYQHNLEKYLERATRDNKKALLDQLAEVKDIMKDIQPGEKIAMPGSEEARTRAHYRNHSLGNTGINPSTWAARAEAIQKDSGKEL